MNKIRDGMVFSLVHLTWNDPYVTTVVIGLLCEGKTHEQTSIILYNEPTSSQLTDKLLYCSYMFRHCCVILREFVVSNFYLFIYLFIYLQHAPLITVILHA
jgi:hypothetical protein